MSLVTNSQTTASDFAEWLDVPRERVGVIYNGLDGNELRGQQDPVAAAAYRRSLGISDGTRVVGSVFQARRTKRPELWIKSAAIIAKRSPDVSFVIVGDTLQREDLATRIAQLGLESRLRQVGTRRDVATWLGMMDVVLLTSQFEGTPNVLLEAQALGRPVVATDVGGNAETFLPGETGLLLSADPTPEDVADAVFMVLNDPAFAERAGKKGPELIGRRFGVHRMAAEIVELCFGNGAKAKPAI